MQTVDPRLSVHNRTMIISKRGRRLGLPEVSLTNDNDNSLPDVFASDVKMPNTARVAPRNHYRRETMTLDTDQCQKIGSDLAARNWQSAIITQMPQSATTTAISQLVPSAVQQSTTIPAVPSISTLIKKLCVDIDNNDSLSDEQKYKKLKAKVLQIADVKEREWNACLAEREKSRLMKAQICDLKLSVANRTSQKAEMFFKICEECGIDFERVIRRESSVIHRLKADALSDIGRCIESPENDAEIARLIKEKELLGDEVRSLETNYSNLFKLYEKMRENCGQLRTAEEQLRFDLCDQNKKYNSLYALYNDLLNDAQQKLKNADLEMKRVEKEHTDKTLGIRMALKKQKIEINSLDAALKSKTIENEELNKICNALLSKGDNAMMVSSIINSDDSAR